MGLQKGDEIVTPACTFSTVIAPMEQLGFKPVFCDVEAGRYVPTVDQILAAITPKTKCCFIPNLVGSKIDWKDLRARVPKGIWLFEDSCDTITHTPESDISVISFYASHIITAGGMGGVVMFNDEALKEKALMFRDWGRIGNNSEDVSERFAHDVDGIEYDFKFLYGCLGYNMKACEMSAAFGLAQLKKLDKFKAMRKANINRYCERLKAAGTSYVLPVNHNDYDWLAFPLMYPDRKGVLRFLEANDVQIRVCFAGNITRHPAYRHYLQDFPASDRIMAEGFLIGAHHGLTFDDVDRVCDLLIEYDKKQGNVQTAGASAKTEKERDSVSLDF
jgi:CDP-6-deoxy-D-xylo-4-hexulose-3-dehydrase